MGKTVMYHGKQMSLRVGNYRSHPTCMQIVGVTEGMFGMKKEIPITASLGERTGDNSVMQLYQGYIHVNDAKNAAETLRILEQTGLGKPMLDEQGQPRKLKFGFHEYPLFQFNKAKLMEYDKQGCQKYEHNFKSAIFIHNIESQVRDRMSAVYGDSDNSYGE